MSATPTSLRQDARVSDILTLEQLAQQFFHTTADAIYSRRARDPDSLPPSIEIPGVKRVFWHRQTVLDWFLSYEHPASVIPLNPDPHPRPAEQKGKKSKADTRKPGAPTKVERVRKQQAARLAIGQGRAS